MDYQGTIIRPPSESNSVILQVTTGCSHNRCTFCGAYQDKSYAIKSLEQIALDIDFAATWCRRQKTVFLADGDALGMPSSMLLPLLERIKEKMPWVRRVSSYASCQNINNTSFSALKQYKHLGLRRVYLGLETGYDPLLLAIGKGVTSQDMRQAAERCREAGFFLSVTCLLGLGGTQCSKEHAAATAAILNHMHPQQIAVLTLMLLPGTFLYQQQQQGTFTLPDPSQLFQELYAMVEGLQPFRTQFYANHASNYFSLQGRLPKDRTRLLAEITNAIQGTVPLKTEASRAL